MHFVRFSDGHKIGVFCPLEPLESLVNEYIVHQKIRQSIGCDSGAYPYAEVSSSHRAGDEAPGTWNGENQKERVILLEETRLVHVEICVEEPPGAVHQVFVR